MENKIKLRKYLLRSFLITLVVIGFVQTIVNLLLGYFLNPILDKVLSMNGLLTSANIRETYSTIFKGLIVFIIQKIAASYSLVGGYVINNFLIRFFDEKLVVTMNELTTKMSGSQVALFIIVSISLFLLILILWLLPYIIGGVVLSRIINKKVNEIEQKRIERDREYDQKRNLLLSDLAHDIKTPITTVAGFSKALADGTIKEENKKDYLNSMYAKAMQISDLINLLFEYVKLDSTGYQLKKTTEDICEVTRGCVARLYTDFEEHEMEIEVNIPETGVYCQIDKTQVERAINNLLTNAIKHNPAHTCIFADVTTEDKYAVISISDKGVAIEKDTAITLFDPFVQGDKSRTSGSGSGLGLSITKKIIEMHGGQIRLIQYKNIEAHNKVKTFEIKLPITK